MRITDLRLTPVAFYDPPLRNSWGTHAPEALRTIIQLDTDVGLTGISETYGGDGPLAELAHAREIIRGEDPYHLERLRLLIESPPTFAAIEVACLDVIGKAGDRPVCDLLGGAVRERVSFSAYLFFKYAGADPWGEVGDPQQMLDLARAWAEKFGFTTFKLKGGVLPPDEEIETVRLLREAFPTAQIRLDPNAIWSVETSLRVARQLRQYDVEYLEDPTADIAGMARVRAGVPDIPLATNMCVKSFADIPPAVQMGAVDVILGDHHFWGGLTGNKRLGQICETFRLGIGMHSNTHLGISLAAMLHSAATIPNLICACDTHYPWQSEDVISSPFRFEGGALPLPTGPGLGVSIDRDKLAALAERYERSRQRSRDDTAEQRRLDARYLPFRPRW
jgi:glucarate dehydratase